MVNHFFSHIFNLKKKKNFKIANLATYERQEQLQSNSQSSLLNATKTWHV